MKEINGEKYFSEKETVAIKDQALAKAQKSAAPPAHTQYTSAKAAREERQEQAHVLGEFFKIFKEKKGSETQQRIYQDLVEKNSDFWRDTKAAFSEASNGAGQYTVPTFWSDMIFNNVERFGFARRLARVMPMPSKTVDLTTAGGVSVSWPGDNTAATAFDATNFFTQTVLTANTMQAGQIIQKELLQDTAVPILQYLTTMVARAVAKEEDKQLFNGTGSPFTGIIGTSGINSVFQGNSAGSGKTAFSNISWVDLVNLAQSLNTESQDGAAFFITQSVYGALRQEASTSRPIWNFSNPIGMAGEQGVNVFTGNPVPLPRSVWSPLDWPCYVIGNGVLPTTAANTVSAVFTNLNMTSVLGVRQDILMETFDEYAFGQELSGTRQIGISTIERVAVGIPLPAGIGVLKTSVS